MDRKRMGALAALVWLAGCGSDGATEAPAAPVASTPVAAGRAATPVSTSTAAGSGGGSAGTSAMGRAPTALAGATAPVAMPTVPAPMPMGGNTGASAGASASAGSPGASAEPPAAGAAGSVSAGPASGPKDGDPAKPVVAVPNIACGPSQAGVSGGNFEFEGRKLIVEYPCEKHEGAHVTIILNLHGTLLMGAPYSYQHAYFSAHRFVNSHNLIVLTPQSVSKVSAGAQWGNMDDGKDVPYLLALLDWAYTTFSKFQIRGLWVGGHSWGAAFVTAPLGGGPFACHPKLQDKVKGAIGMSRLSMPSCASQLSLISTRGEKENIALLDQSKVAMGHGCKAPMAGPKPVGNNEYRYFEGCGPGWVHEDYMMTGKGHIDSMDQEVVKNIVDAIKSTEQ